MKKDIVDDTKVTIGQSEAQRYGEQATVTVIDPAGSLSVCFESGNVYEGIDPSDFLNGRLVDGRRFVGARFGQLEIVDILTKDRMVKKPSFLVRCSCGNEFSSGIASLIGGHGRKSCGHCDYHSEKMLASIEKRREAFRKDIIGKKLRGKDGGIVTIIEVFDRKHVKVKNERGFSWVTDYGHIKDGDFLSFPQKEKILLRKGLKNIQRSGYVAEITEVKDRRYVHCVLDDGCVVPDPVLYKDFIAGRIKHPEGKTRETKVYRGPFVGESKLSYAGERMVVCELSEKDHTFTVQFDDGVRCKNVSYEPFIVGRIRKPDKDGSVKTSSKSLVAKKEIEGKIFITNQGFKIEVVKYEDSHHVLVRFLDDGSEKYTTSGDIKRGEVAHPIYGRMRKAERIGESYIQNNGLRLTIVGSGKVNACRAVFDDGTEIEAKYASITNGTVRHPKETEAMKIENRVGETSIAANGQKMTIIEAYSKRNVTVKFEDGTIVEHKSYQMFKDGHIENPNRTCRMVEWEKQIGKEIRMKCGLVMKVKGNSEEQVKGVHCFDLEAADGRIIRNRPSGDINRGDITHPAFRIQRGSLEERVFCGYSIVSQAFMTSDNNVFYNVVSDTGESLVMSPQMMLAQAYIKGKVIPDWAYKYFEKELENIKAAKDKIADLSCIRGN